MEEYHLNEDSVYAPGKDILEPIINYETVRKENNSMRPEEFAKQIYEATVVGVSKRRVYAGTQTPLTDMLPEQSVSSLSYICDLVF